MSDTPYESAFGEGLAPGTGPGAAPVYVPPAELRVERPLERNVAVGPLLVSACRCPHCGQIYAHFTVGQTADIAHWYAGCLADDEPDPPCYRCEVAYGVPLDPEEVRAMQHFRWRFDQYVNAHEVGSMKSQAQMRAALLAMSASAEMHAPVLLQALERRYGNQQDAGVQQVLNEGV